MIPWPMPGRLDALISLQTYAEWQAFYLLNTNLARTLAEACRMVFKTSETSPKRRRALTIPIRQAMEAAFKRQ